MGSVELVLLGPWLQLQLSSSVWSSFSGIPSALWLLRGPSCFPVMIWLKIFKKFYVWVYVHTHTRVCVCVSCWEGSWIIGSVFHLNLVSRKAFCIILTFFPFRLQDIIGQRKAEDTEKKDEPSKDNLQQALIDQRYFQVLNNWQRDWYCSEPWF